MHNSPRRVGDLLALQAWRSIIRRPIPRPVLLAVYLLLLAGYGSGIYAITHSAFASYEQLHLSRPEAVWFMISIYLSAVPLVGIILAYTFQPAFIAATEAIAGLPMSPAEWYAPQIRRYILAVAAILTASWLSISLAMGEVLHVAGTLQTGLAVLAVLLNATVTGLLLVVISLNFYSQSERFSYLAPAVYTILMTGIVYYARNQQNGSLRVIARFIDQHLLGAVSLSLGGAAMIMAGAAWLAYRLQRRNAGRALQLVLSPAQPRLLQRLLPMPPGVGPKLAMATLRGLVLDRKNLVIIASSYVVLLAFAIMARSLHAPALNSLILTMAAMYAPLFLSLVSLFARGTLGTEFYLVYIKPVSHFAVSLWQYLAVCLAAAALTLAFVVSLLYVVGNRIVGGELIIITLNTACVCAIGYLAGSLWRLNQRSQVTVLTGIASLFVLAGGFYMVMEKLSFTGWPDYALRAECLAGLFIAAAIIEQLRHTRIPDRRA